MKFPRGLMALLAGGVGAFGATAAAQASPQIAARPYATPLLVGIVGLLAARGTKTRTLGYGLLGAAGATSVYAYQMNRAQPAPETAALYGRRYDAGAVIDSHVAPQLPVAPAPVTEVMSDADTLGQMFG